MIIPNVESWKVRGPSTDVGKPFEEVTVHKLARRQGRNYTRKDITRCRERKCEHPSQDAGSFSDWIWRERCDYEFAQNRTKKGGACIHILFLIIKSLWKNAKGGLLLYVPHPPGNPRARGMMLSECYGWDAELLAEPRRIRAE